MQLGLHSISSNNYLCHNRKQNKQSPPSSKKESQVDLVFLVLSRSEWPQGRVRPPPAHRMSFRLAGVQPLRSSGMRWKMKHFTNHTVELLHPSQEWTSVLWEFDSVSPQGGRAEMGAFQSLWPVAFSDR